MPKRPRIGDVIELHTPAGLAYAHFTHKHRQYGALLRILQGLFTERPESFTALVQQQPRFSTFFPLGAACNQGICLVVGNEVLPEHTRDFPIFRGCNWHRDKSGTLQRGATWLWDGDTEWRVDTLAPEQLRDYPPRGVVNDTMLIERIVSGWRHEDEPPSC